VIAGLAIYSPLMGAVVAAEGGPRAARLVEGVDGRDASVIKALDHCRIGGSRFTRDRLTGGAAVFRSASRTSAGRCPKTQRSTSAG
jgi:hypothetical protein